MEVVGRWRKPRVVCLFGTAQPVSLMYFLDILLEVWIYLDGGHTEDGSDFLGPYLEDSAALG